MVQELNTSHLLSNMTTVILSPSAGDKSKLSEEDPPRRDSLPRRESLPRRDSLPRRESLPRRDDSLRHSDACISATSISSSSQQDAYLRSKRSFYAQCLMNAALVMLLTGYGMPIGFSGIVSPKLQAANSSISIDEETASWVVSVHSIATPMGAILAGPLMDEFGRKTTLQISIIPIVLGWLLISLSPNATVLILGRLLAGFAVGMGPAPSQILIGEISEPKLRGFFGSTPSASYALGILIVYGMSSLCDWRVVAALGATLPALAFLLLCFLPESPTWYIKKNRPEDARRSLLWLRGGDREKTDEELQSLLLLMKSKSKQLESPEDPPHSPEVVSIMGLLKRPLRLFCLPEVKRPFSIVITFAILQILSGSYIVIFYAVELVSIATDSRDQSMTVTIAVMTALTRFVVSILVSVLLFFVGRRTLAMLSGVGTGLACLCIVGYLYCTKHKVALWGYDFDISHSESSGFVTVACLILLYVAMNTLGIFSLPMLLMAETLPANARGLLGGFTVMLVNIFIFTTTKMYPYTTTVVGPMGIFTWFSAVSFVIALFIYLYLPETKNRSLSEIEFYFSTRRNHLWITRDKALYKRKKKSESRYLDASTSSDNLT